MVDNSQKLPGCAAHNRFANVRWGLAGMIAVPETAVANKQEQISIIIEICIQNTKLSQSNVNQRLKFHWFDGANREYHWGA